MTTSNNPAADTLGRQLLAAKRERMDTERAMLQATHAPDAVREAAADRHADAKAAVRRIRQRLWDECGQIAL